MALASFWSIVCVIILAKSVFPVNSLLPELSNYDVVKDNTVLISILVRNKGHILPHFLTYLEKLDYPKDRISLWIRSDNNIDNSIEVVQKWLNSYADLYHSVHSFLDKKSSGLEEEEGIAHWPVSRYRHIIPHRENALYTARQMWADYLWMLDCDVFITNPMTLKDLIKKQLAIVAPALRSDGLYSNFWCGMSDEFYYVRTEDYGPILNRKKKGCFSVPMVHSSVLIDLRVATSDKLTYSPETLKGYTGPIDDIITFARSANMSGLNMTVCNDAIYGYVMVPLEKDDRIEYDLVQLRNLKLEILIDNPPLKVDPVLSAYVVEAEEPQIPVNKTYMINLKRRPDRRTRMQNSFRELHLDAETIDAVDGRSLSDEDLKNLGVKMMPGYEDPFHKRPMKRGEIGCFLSHYSIWNKVRQEGFDIAMVLEDDVRFEPFFNQKMVLLLQEVRSLPFEWDLIYLGRKKLDEKNEEPVEGMNHLVWAGYSYWTLGYLLSARGAVKLLAQNPLNNVLPVDEYLPILYDKHPSDEWKSFYPKRDLVALSVEPLILYPTRYLHEEGYISDTEDSAVVSSAPLTAPTPSPEL